MIRWRRMLSETISTLFRSARITGCLKAQTASKHRRVSSAQTALLLGVLEASSYGVSGLSIALGSRIPKVALGMLVIRSIATSLVWRPRMKLHQEQYPRIRSNAIAIGIEIEIVFF